MTCPHCGRAAEKEFCSTNCQIGWKRRTSDPMSWTPYEKEILIKVKEEPEVV